MIEWIEKLPDSVIGLLAAGGVWFGFNYAVLADRAIAKEHATSVVPNCAAVVEARTRFSLPPASGLGQALGLPALDQIEKRAFERMKPRMLTQGERQDRCTCAAKRAGQKLRFDFAIHTASFRIISPQAVSEFADDTAAIALSGTCGAIPNPLKGGIQ